MPKTVESLYDRVPMYMTMPGILNARQCVTCATACRTIPRHAKDRPAFARGRRYLRIPRSADVSASENAGRANSRSAYFMSGAACFGIWMP